MFEFLDPLYLLTTFGLIGLWAIIFAESGLLIGFFLPGDSLLFVAGFLASQGLFNIWWLIGGAAIAAVVGDSVGYAFGRRVGPRIFSRPDSRWFKQAYVEKAKKFYELHGKKTIILARFVPVVRTFAPILAGVGLMHYPTFLTYNLIGGLLWAVGMPLLGFFLGSFIPGIDQYILPIVAVIIIVSILPGLAHLRSRRR